MQGRLKVKNFGILKNIDININDFTIIIGSQAQGKSLIAKLVYFFNSFYKIVINNLSDREKEFNLILIESFKEFFPDYIIDKFDDFTIEYFFLNYKVPILIKNNKLTSKRFEISIPKSLYDEIEYLEKSFKNKKQPFEYKKNGLFSQESIFIPAGRSFFSYLRKHIFSLINLKVSLDKVLVEFGMLQEPDFIVDYKTLSDLLGELFKDLKIDHYEIKNNEEFITIEDKKIKAVNFSSGQQEALPMITTILQKGISKNKNQIIIEEPEAHLFPATQQKIIEFIAVVYNILSKKNTSFFITTHSPYILSSLNNLIQANNAYKSLKKNGKNTSKVNKIISKSKWVELIGFQHI